MLTLDILHLLMVHLHSHFLGLEQVIENLTASLAVYLQDLSDSGLFCSELG